MMSSQVTCDRCGSVEQLWKKPSEGAVLTRKVTVQPGLAGIGPTGQSVDLCYRCTQAFSRWIKEGA